MSIDGKQKPKEAEIRDLLPGYVLGILEPEELLAVDDYLARRPDLRGEVHRMEQTIGQLAFVAPPASPSARLKGQIMARAQSEVEPTEADASFTVPTTERADGAVAPSRAVPARTPTRHRTARPTLSPQRATMPEKSLANKGWSERLGAWWRDALGWKMYAVATTTALALLAILFNQTQQNLGNYFGQLAVAEAELAQADAARTEAEAQLSTANNEYNALGTEVENLRTANAQLQADNQQLALDLDERDAELQSVKAVLEELSQQQDDLYFALQSADQLVPLQGTNSDASGSLLATSDGGYLTLSGLEPLGEDQTYQLWLIPEGQAAVDSGLVAVTSSETTSILVDLPLDVGGTVTVGLSIEPAGGQEEPTVENIVLLSS